VTSVACSLLAEHPVRTVAQRATTAANRTDLLSMGIERL
jgi:hypothetical protein